MRITISGFPGAGKGILKDNLARYYGIKSFSVGDLRREYAKGLGISIQELNERSEQDPIWDLRADEHQRKWANERSDFVLEGRLSYHFIPESVRVFLSVDDRVGGKRIFEKERDSEKAVGSIDDQIRENRLRCESDRRRYGIKEYRDMGVGDCYDERNFDVIVDTTNRSEEEVLDVVTKKIKDYDQKMNPPTFYFGHPTRAKDDGNLQRAFEGISERLGISFFNPFKDNPNELPNSKGESSYESMSEEQKTALAESDLLAVLDKRIIGGIFVYTGDFTVATQMESLISFLSGKLNYIVTPKGDKEFLRNHPFFSRIKTADIFPSIDRLEGYLTENRNDLFMRLREAREAWAVDPISQRLYSEMKTNEMYLGR